MANTNNTVEYIVNILLHIFILLTLLSVLYWFVISKTESTSLQKEITTNVGNLFTNIENSLTPIQKLEAQGLAIVSRPGLNILEKIYSNPEPKIYVNNDWLVVSNILYIFIIFAVLATILLTLKYGCGINNFPIYEMLKENLATFTIVGIFELLFFFFVALKYSPTMPSKFINSVFQDIKQNI